MVNFLLEVLLTFTLSLISNIIYDLIKRKWHYQSAVSLNMNQRVTPLVF